MVMTRDRLPMDGAAMTVGSLWLLERWHKYMYPTRSIITMNHGKTAISD